VTILGPYHDGAEEGETTDVKPAKCKKISAQTSPALPLFSGAGRYGSAGRTLFAGWYIHFGEVPRHSDVGGVHEFFWGVSVNFDSHNRM